MTIDIALKHLLERFAIGYLARSQPMEALCVRVERKARFTHIAHAARGLSIHLDEPTDFGGAGLSPDPAEHLLAAIGASLSVTLTAHAALRDIPLEVKRIIVSGKIDARPFFEPSKWQNAGVVDMAIELFLATDTDQARIEGLLQDVLRVSPVLASLKTVPRVELRLEMAGS